MAGPTFSQHFPSQVNPHYIQLDPIYYEFMLINESFLTNETLQYLGSNLRPVLKPALEKIRARSMQMHACLSMLAAVLQRVFLG